MIWARRKPRRCYSMWQSVRSAPRILVYSEPLSRELEELPQVSPKFSLVDAIMPQLDAIDEARKEQSSTIQEMNPVPATFENLQRSSERKTKQKWLNSMAGRMSMGAAAAAVILGFAIWGNPPEQIENADSMLMVLELLKRAAMWTRIH